MKLPKKAKLVFKGIIFDVYQWEQEMFDGSIQTFEMLKRPNTVLVIPTQNNKILIAHQDQPHKKDYYSLVGGRGDPDETPLTTAKRELLEETGLVSSSWKLFKIYEPFAKFDWNIYIYIAKNCKKIADQKLDAGERIRIKMLTFNQFLKKIESGNFWGGEFALDIMKISKDNKKVS